MRRRISSSSSWLTACYKHAKCINACVSTSTPIFGSRQPSLRKDRACPRYRVAPLARQSLTRFENLKSLSSCLPEVVRITLPETRREAKRSCVSSALCRQVLKLLTFQGRLLCSIANCLSSLRRLADFSALAPARRVRFPMGREPPQGAVTPALSI